MGFTATISGSPVHIYKDSLGIDDKIEEQSDLKCTVWDPTGALNFTKDQPMSIVDDTRGTIYAGFINNQPEAVVLYPNPGRMWALDCRDQTWCASKRTTNKVYKSQYAGTILVDMIQRHGGAEGLFCRANLGWYELLTEWQAGTMSGVSATTNAFDVNPGDGDVELAIAGSQVRTTGAAGAIPLVNALYVTGYSNQTGNNATTNSISFTIWTGSQAIANVLDFLQYQVWVRGDSAAIVGAVDFVCSDGTTFRSTNALDIFGLSCAPKTDLSAMANNQWYPRQIFMPASLVGKTISQVNVHIETTANGQFNMWFQSISYSVHNGSPTVFFDVNSTLSAATVVTSSNFTNVAVSTVQAGQFTTDVVTHSSVSISAAAIVQSSQISWSQVIPSGCNIVLETSIDNQASWQVATSGSAIPDLLAGMSVSGRVVYYRHRLSLGSDPTAAISLIANAPLLIVNPAYAATKSDVITSYTSQSDFNTGTATNTAWSPNGLGWTLNGFQQVWGNNPLTLSNNQTTFGTGTAAIRNRSLILTCTNAEIRSRLDFAGSWADFTAEVDITIGPDANSKGGLVYRTTGWQNNDSTYAYCAQLSTTAVQIRRGSNSSTGTGPATTIATATANFAANSTHRLKVVVSGSSHIISVDGIQYISQTDATYLAAGSLALRQTSTNVAANSAIFENFGICAALTGTWQSPSISISGPGTYGTSAIFWDIDQIPNTAQISVQTSTDAGSTWQNVTNGGAISSLTPGQSLAAKTLLLKVTFTAQNAPVVPTLAGISAWVVGQYSSSGVWQTGPLGYDSFTKANQSGFGKDQIGLPWVQVAGTDTLSINSNKGVVTSSASAASNRILLGSATAADCEALVRVTVGDITGDTAGILLRSDATGANHYLARYAPGSANTLEIDKRVAGTLSTLASPAAGFTFAANSLIWIKFRAQGTTLSIKAWLDGTSEPAAFNGSVTDSALASGQFGLYASGAPATGPKFDSFSATPYPDRLSLAAVGRATSSLVSWNANLPTGTSLVVTTSIDKGATWQTVAASGNAISGIALPPAPVIDSFATNTSANYTQSNFGGTTGTWTWDTANSRLTGSGGNGGTIVYNTALTSADAQTAGDFDQADGSGLIANYQSASAMYYVQAWDASGTGTPNTVKLFRRSGGVSTQVGTTATIDWPRGRKRRFILDVQAGVLTVSVDGAVIITYTDGSPLAAGKSGLLLNTLLRCYSLRIQQYGPVVTSFTVYTRLTLSTTDATKTPQVLDLQTFVSSSDIDPGALISKGEYLRTYLEDNIKDLNTQSATTYTNIRFDKSVIFQQRTATPAPWILDSANKTSIGPKKQGDLLVANLKLIPSGDLYRNRQILTGVNDTFTFNETRTGDGQTRTWNLSNEVAGVPTITLNGQPVSVGIKGIDSGRQYYYQPGSTAIDQDSSQAILQKDVDVLAITYLGSFVTEVVRDNATAGTFPGTLSQAEMKLIDQTSGIVENVLDVSKMNMNVAAAQTYGDQLLKKYGVTSARTLTFDTLRPGLAPGQQLPAFVPEQGCNDAQFLITQVSTKGKIAQVPGGVLYTYSITATEGANLGSSWKMLSSLLQ